MVNLVLGGWDEKACNKVGIYMKRVMVIINLNKEAGLTVSIKSSLQIVYMGGEVEKALMGTFCTHCQHLHSRTNVRLCSCSVFH